MCVSIHTDYHDVDEDLATIAHYGGDWVDNDGPGAGIARRNLYRSSSYTSDFVASSDMKKISNYTDDHDVDEDMAAILAQGAMWIHNTWAGVMARDMYADPSDLSFYINPYVASKK